MTWIRVMELARNEVGGSQMGTLREAALKMFAKRLHRIWQTSDVDWNTAFQGLARIPGALGPSLVRVLTTLDPSLAFAAVTRAEVLKPYAHILLRYVQLARDLMIHVNPERFDTLHDISDAVRTRLDSYDAECVTRLMGVVWELEHDGRIYVGFRSDDGESASMIIGRQPGYRSRRYIDASNKLVQVVDLGLKRAMDGGRAPLFDRSPFEWVIRNPLCDLPTASTSSQAKEDRKFYLSLSSYYSINVPFSYTRLNVAAANVKLLGNRVRLAGVEIGGDLNVRELPVWLGELKDLDEVCVDWSAFGDGLDTLDIAAQLFSSANRLCIVCRYGLAMSVTVQDVLKRAAPREIRWISNDASDIRRLKFPNDADRLITGREMRRGMALIQTLVCQVIRIRDFESIARCGGCLSVTVIDDSYDNFELFSGNMENDASDYAAEMTYGTDIDPGTLRRAFLAAYDQRTMLIRYALHLLFRSLGIHLPVLEYLDLHLPAFPLDMLLEALHSAVTGRDNVKIIRVTFWDVLRVIPSQADLPVFMSRFDDEYTWSIVNRKYEHGWGTHITLELRRRSQPRGQKRSFDQTRLLRL